jgi:thiol-disulfide isomerase/thioredoxin
MKWYYPVVISSLLLLGAGCTNTNPVSSVDSPETRNVVPADSVSMQRSSSVGAYEDYSSETVAAAQAAGKKVVLFFHAQWCPYCRAADAAFRAHPENILDGYVVLKTDYDSEAVLKKKYGVTYQHTFVQIDTDGNLVSTWISGDIDALAQNVK